MSFKDISQIAGSAMSAQTVRLNTIASNLANAGTSGTEETAYRARKPVVEDPVFGFRAAGPALLTNNSYFERRICSWEPREVRAS